MGGPDAAGPGLETPESPVDAPDPPVAPSGPPVEAPNPSRDGSDWSGKPPAAPVPLPGVAGRSHGVGG